MTFAMSMVVMVVVFVLVIVPMLMRVVVRMTFRMAVLVTVGVLVVMIVTVIISMCMRVLLLVRMFMLVAMIVVMIMRMTVTMVVIVRMVMTVTVPLLVHLLRKRVVFGKRLVVPVLVPATIGARLRRKRCIDRFDAHAEPTQHIGEHRIALDLEITVADLDGRMTITEVIGSTRKHERRRTRDAQYRFGCGGDTNHRTVVGNKHITVSEDRAAW